jgi:hypothetical protein
MERCPRLEKVTDDLFEGEEAVLHVMGVQIASEKRRTPWTSTVWSLRCQAFLANGLLGAEHAVLHVMG